MPEWGEVYDYKSGMRDVLIEHFRSLVKIINTEDGTVDWTVHISPIEPDSVWLYEVYQDQTAMDFHNSTEINAQAKIKTSELTIGRPEVFPLIPVVSKGLDPDQIVK
jgi:quinol monooxygenase YgiN